MFLAPFLPQSGFPFLSLDRALNRMLRLVAPGAEFQGDLRHLGLGVDAHEVAPDRPALALPAPPLLQGLRIELDGIAWKNKPDDATNFLVDLGNPFALTVADQSGRTGIDFGVYGVPESYLIDQDGNIRYRQVGPFTEDDVEKKLKPLIAELSK